MLYSVSKKIGVILIPKTGTSALHSVLANNIQFDFDKHEHATVKQFSDILVHNGYNTAVNTYYGIYRNPVDWFLSCCNYYKQVDQQLKMTLLETLGIKQFTFFERRSNLVSDQHIIDYIPVKDVVQALSAIRDSGNEDKISKRIQLWKLQHEYLDYENVTLLSYSDMLGSVNTILEAFDCQPVQVVPLANVTQNKLHTRDNISEEDLAAIQEFCKADYEFFEKKGISFEV